MLDKSGLIKDDLFFKLCELHGVILSPEARTVITSSYRKGDKINYIDAMPVICIDIETTVDLQEQKWTVRKNNGGGKIYDNKKVFSDT